MATQTPLSLRPAHVRALRLSAHHLTDATVAHDLLEAASPGLPDSPPGSGVQGVAARMPSAGPADVRRALEVDHSLVIAWTRRGAAHLVPANDLGVFTRGLLPDDEESWRIAIAGYAKHLESAGNSAEELVRLVADAALRVLDGRELPLREFSDEIRDLMPSGMRARFEPDVFAAFTTALIRASGLFGGVIVLPRAGDEVVLGRSDAWLGSAPIDDSARARVEMARRYLSFCGPSLPRAYAEWAGIGEAQARRAFDALADDVVPVRVEGADGLLLAEDAARVFDLPQPEGVRLLPHHDAYLSCPDRRVIASDVACHKELWKAAGNPGAVLLGDEVVGTWRAAVHKGVMQVRIGEFRTMPASARVRVKELAERLARFEGVRRVQVHF